MREIKFRGKTYQGKWIYGYCYKVKSLFDSNIFNWFIRNDYEKDEIIIPETLSQYTGLKDKNGVEIYEGDICVGNGHIEKGDEKFIIKYGKYKTEEWQETYSCNTYQFGWYAEFIKSKSQVHLVIPNGIRVIGNIYEDLKESGE